jgi:hypothetical protein
MFSRLQNTIWRPGQTLKVFPAIISLFIIHYSLFISIPPARAQNYSPSGQESGLFNSIICCGNKQIVPINAASCAEIKDPCLQDMCGKSPQNLHKYDCGGLTEDPGTGQVYSPGMLGFQSQLVAQLFESQPSSKEYIADILDNIGIPTVSRAYAQGTGYGAMSAFLPFWKVFRNLAYSLYIIMFVVVGIMIMLRTKVNAQTIITIQTALPNLLITLLLITFSYAIVGFMIDLMYFLIYFVVYLGNASGIINDPTKLITRFMTNSA